MGGVPQWFSVGLEAGGLLGALLSQIDMSVSVLEEGLCRYIRSSLTPNRQPFRTPFTVDLLNSFLMSSDAPVQKIACRSFSDLSSGVS